MRQYLQSYVLKLVVFIQSLFLIILLLWHEASATESRSHYVFEKITVLNGLTQNTSNDIYQDNRGFIWIATQDGLNRYDGENVKTFRHNRNDTSSLSYNSISKVGKGFSNDLIVTTLGGGFNLIDIYSLHVSPVTKERHPELKSNRINDFCTQDNLLFLALEDGGVQIMNNKLEDLTTKELAALPLKNVLSINIVNGDDLWIGGHNFELYKYNLSSRELTNHSNLFSSEDNGSIIRIDLLDESRIGFSTDTGGFIFDVHKDDLQKISSSSIQQMVLGDKDELWIATSKEGVLIYNILDLTLKERIVNNPYDTRSLGSNALKSIFRDREGLFWVGTHTAGLNVINPISALFQTFDKSTLAGEVIGYIGEDSFGNIWVGTYDGGLNILKASGNSPKFSSEFFDLSGVIDMVEVGTKFYLATVDKSILVYDINTSILSRINTFKDGGLISSPVTDLIILGDGDIYFCTYGQGIGKIDTKKNIATKVRIPSNSIDSDYLFRIFQDSIDSFYLASGRNGLLKFSSLNNHIEKVEIKDKKGQLLPINEVYFIDKDDAGNLLLGTSDGFLIKKRDETYFRLFNTDAGLPNDIVLAALAHGKDVYWLSTNNGLCLISYDSQQYKYSFRTFDYRDGLQSNEFNQLAYFKDSEGYLYFGGIQGLNVLDPRAFNVEPRSPDVYLLGLKFSGKEVKLDSNLIANRQFQIKVNENQVFIDFAVADLLASGKYTYSYYLEGFDDDWQLNNRNFATYNNLPSGVYQFFVRTSYRGGAWNDKQHLLTLVVPVPFWKNTYVVVSVISSIVLLILYLFFIKDRNAQRMAQKLAQEVQERTEELKMQNEEILLQKSKIEDQNIALNDAHSIIEEKNTQLKIANEKLEATVEKRTKALKSAYQKVLKYNEALDSIIYRTAHDLNGPLARIKGLITLGKYPESYEGRAKLLKMAEAELNNIEKILQKQVFLKNLEAHVIRSKKFFLRDLIDKILLNLEKTVMIKDVIIDIDCEIDEPIITDYKLMDSICGNLIENALVFSKLGDDHQPIVIIHAKKMDNGYLIFSVHDNGLGIETSILDRIFDQNFRGDERSRGNGSGLYIVNTAIELLGGSIEVSISKAAGGANFICTIPVKWG
ncbi:MAG: hypothetical protein LAT68_02265 [Cyclobacteriaceae bacterium]|nr:hypothetical protein [Cyclobacteriaceae bacterium]MCH8515128.1 hypothetical protein [Cyclobacteriaceae bacterium]